MSAPIEQLAARARRIRRHVVRQGTALGPGQLGPALGLADVLAVLVGDQLRLEPAQPDLPGRDQLLLSCDQGAVALHAALSDAGLLRAGTAGLPDATAGIASTPTASASAAPVPAAAAPTTAAPAPFGEGLAVAVERALALRTATSERWIVNLMVEAELDCDPTWVAARTAAQQGLGHLLAVVDLDNRLGAARSGAPADHDHLVERWRSAGWRVERVDGNQIGAVRSALDGLRTQDARHPKVLLADTRLGHGVPFLSQRARSTDLQLAPDEWSLALAALDDLAHA